MYWAASDLGRETDFAFVLVTGACAVLLFLITALTVYFVSRYSRKRNPVASQIEGNAPLEIGWTVGGVVIVVVMFYWGWVGYRERAEPPAGALEIEATAQMWHWSFKYPDGMESDTLLLEAGKPVKINLRSRDVIHSLYIPSFRVKQDVVPGAEKFLWFTPLEPGEYNIFCTEYCGTGHSRMLSKAVVTTAEEYARRAKPAEVAPTGEALYKAKGCSACHTIDGSALVCPTWKGLYGHRVKVLTDGKEREVVADEEYLKKSILEPNADVVAGFPPIMPSQKGVLKDEEVRALVDYIKSLE